MLQIDDAILATTRVEPGKLSLGESTGGSARATLTMSNTGSSRSPTSCRMRRRWRPAASTLRLPSFHTSTRHERFL